MIGEYIKEKGAFLKGTFEAMFLKKSTAFDASKTKYFEKGYVQKILTAKK